MKDEDYLTYKEVARQMGVTSQAIYVAMRKGRIKSTLRQAKGKKRKEMWMIHQNDLLIYQGSKYSRAFSKHNGKLIFNPKEGKYSIRQVAMNYGIPIQRVYYLIRSKNLKAHKIGGTFVIFQRNIDEYQQSRELSKVKADEKGIRKIRPNPCNECSE